MHLNPNFPQPDDNEPEEQDRSDMHPRYCVNVSPIIGNDGYVGHLATISAQSMINDQIHVHSVNLSAYAVDADDYEDPSETLARLMGLVYRTITRFNAISRCTESSVVTLASALNPHHSVVPGLEETEDDVLDNN
jgi:hypothetical protein